VTKLQTLCTLRALEVSSPKNMSASATSFWATAIQFLPMLEDARVFMQMTEFEQAVVSGIRNYCIALSVVLFLFTVLLFVLAWPYLGYGNSPKPLSDIDQWIWGSSKKTPDSKPKVFSSYKLRPSTENSAGRCKK
jgi:hypothetical protein